MNSNPFTVIFGVEPKSFIPRTAEYSKIVSEFQSDYPTTSAYVITGVRGCGKTVLMTSLQNYFSKKDDWFVLRLNPDLDLFASAISQLGEHIHLKNELITEISISAAGFGGGVTKRSLSDDETLLRKMLKEAGKQGKKVLIAIDEVSNTQSIKTFAHSYQAFIGERLPVFLIMTALPENFSALSNSRNGTFLQRMPKIRLGALSDMMVEEKYRDLFKIPEKTAVSLTKTVMGYPYAFQLLGSILWEEGKTDVDNKILSKLDAMLYEGSYQAIWNHMSAKEKDVVRAIAHSETFSVKEIRESLHMEANQFSPYRENLKEAGLINTDTYGVVKFCLPRFKEFVIKAEQYML